MKWRGNCDFQLVFTYQSFELKSLPLCFKNILVRITILYRLYVDHVLVKAYTCYRSTAVAGIHVNPEFSLLIFFSK